MIDLHCHSIFSDGALTPEELVKRALQYQVKILSLTDHDTYEGYDSLKKYIKNTDITLIHGIELSVLWRKHELHILGYQLLFDENLVELVSLQNESRVLRAKTIGARLESIGVMDAYEKACLIAGHKRASRLHFAKVLLAEGKVGDLQSAFRRFLGRGKIAYVSSPWINLTDVVSKIKQSGGQAVIAHPLKYGLTRTKLHELIKDFKELGGAGIEVVSGEMSIAPANELAALCVKFDMLASSGSDFHSDKDSRVKLGCQMSLPANCTPIWHNWAQR